jgi:hypothetical protein
MSFNKKRACCCNQQPGEDDFFFEVQSAIPIASAEKNLTGTYSFWIEVEGVTTSGGVPVDSTLIWEYVSTQINNEAGSNVTLGSWKTETDRLVFIPNPFEFNIHHTDGKIYQATSQQQVGLDALRFRGFHMNSSPRMLTRTEWEALDEIKVLMRLPEGVNQSAGGNKFRAYKLYGYFFGLDQFDDEPAIGPTTFGDLTWEMYPKVNANMPVQMRATEINGTAILTFFDFTALFPSTLNVTVEGSIPVAYRRSGLEVDQCLGTLSPTPLGASLDVNLTLTYDKTVSASGVMSYVNNQTSEQRTVGEDTINWDIPEEDCFGITIPAAPDQSADFKYIVSAFTISMYNGSSGFEGIPQSTIAGCVDDIGYNPNGNRLLCGSCNANSSVHGLGRFCSPRNYDGDFFKDKQHTDLFNDVFDDSSPVDVGNGSNYPTGIGYDFRRLQSLWCSPVLVWGAATGSAVTLEIKAPQGPGLNSFLLSDPVGACGAGTPGPHFVFAFGDVPVLFDGLDHSWTGLPTMAKKIINTD